MVGLKNGHIHKNLTQNGEPRDLAGNADEEPFYSVVGACVYRQVLLNRTIINIIAKHLSRKNIDVCYHL